jgi:hypothetical protein
MQRTLRFRQWHSSCTASGERVGKSIVLRFRDGLETGDTAREIVHRLFVERYDFSGLRWHCIYGALSAKGIAEATSQMLHRLLRCAGPLESNVRVAASACKLL